MSRTLLNTAALCFVLSASPALAQDKRVADDKQLPYAPATLEVHAPSARGPWSLRVVNRGDVPLRMQADARLATLLVAPAGSKYTECVLPGPLRARAERAVELKPGEAWEESFDPRLWCFGKLVDALGPGTSVTAFWGYKPDAQRLRARKPQVAPFAVEPALAPPVFAPAKRLVSLTTWVPPEPSGEAASEQPEPGPVAINTGRLVVEPVRFVDAPAPGDVRVSATVRNAGDRAATVHLRADQLEFRVRAPGGAVALCASRERRRAPVRDFFRTLAPKASETLTVLLAEVCPRDLFSRPGIYEVSTVLRANAEGRPAGVSAESGDFVGSRTTLVRLQEAKAGYYTSAPRLKAAQPK
jgi:hypothetical protein